MWRRWAGARGRRGGAYDREERESEMHARDREATQEACAGGRDALDKWKDFEAKNELSREIGG